MLQSDLQSRAQAELDSVTGTERLPTFEDRSRLPFLDALCKETQRWRPVTPLGMSMVTSDDYPGASIRPSLQHFLILLSKTMSMRASLYQKVRRFFSSLYCY